MASKKPKYILFDAANTLIYKPDLLPSMHAVLEKNGYKVQMQKLNVHHKLISEVISFPDKTSKDFYQHFNTEVLLSLGIIPSDILLNEIFAACSYLPWQCFKDTEWLSINQLPKGVLSNFNNGLTELMQNLFGDIFSDVIVSEDLNIRKPDPAFFQYALDKIGLPADQVLYVGDSLKLDIIPAKKIGFQVVLIDRIKAFPKSKETINTLSDLPARL